MGIPTDEELKQALAVAGKMRESGNDDEHLAKCLMSLNYRFNKAVDIVEQLRIYLHGGMSGIEHAKLVKSLKDFENIQHPNDTSRFGLE